MRIADTWLPGLLAAAIGLAGCFKIPESESPPGDDDNAEADDDDTAAGDETLTLYDGNNYHVETTLDIAGRPLSPVHYPCDDPGNQVCDITISWCSLTRDLRRQPLDPIDDIDMVSLFVFEHLSRDDVELALRDDQLQQQDLSLYINNEEFVDNGAFGDICEVRLGDMGLFGGDVDAEQYFDPSYGDGPDGASWLLLLSTGTEPLAHIRMGVFLIPTEGETADHVEMDDGDIEITTDAQISNMGPAGLTMYTTPQITWADVTTSADGLPFSVGGVDTLMIGHFPDTAPIDLQDHVLYLDVVAEELWSLEVGATTSADLSQASGDGGPFTGVYLPNTWLLWMWDEGSLNPVPDFLTILAPRY